MRVLSILTVFGLASTALGSSREDKLDDLHIGITSKSTNTHCVSNGDIVSVHYNGFLRDKYQVGSQDGLFDSSYERGSPIQFKVGAGQVIKGWDQGLLGCCIGEKRKLQIPSSMGYGERGAGGVIPPNADLLFEVDLVDIS